MARLSQQRQLLLTMQVVITTASISQKQPISRLKGLKALLYLHQKHEVTHHPNVARQSAVFVRLSKPHQQHQHQTAKMDHRPFAKCIQRLAFPSARNQPKRDPYWSLRRLTDSFRVSGDSCFRRCSSPGFLLYVFLYPYQGRLAHLF